MCEGVEEDLQEYSFTRLGDAGQEKEDTATIATVRDITYDTEKVINVDEQWIWGIVYIRSHRHTASSPCPSIIVLLLLLSVVVRLWDVESLSVEYKTDKKYNVSTHLLINF